MGYRERIEKVVIAMFNADRLLTSILDEDALTLADGSMRFSSEWNGLCDIAMDLLGMPKDNTTDYDYSLSVNWPKGCFCRDFYIEGWIDGFKNGQEFIDSCYSALKEVADNNETFTEPKI
jgi:hypothetical protein